MACLTERCSYCDTAREETCGPTVPHLGRGRWPRYATEVRGRTLSLTVVALLCLASSGCRRGPSGASTPREAQPPRSGPPTDLQATTAGPSIVLNWIAPEEGGGLVGYNIYRDDAGGVPIGSVGSGTTTYTDTSVAPGTTYCYHVSADYGEGESQWPQPACAGTQGAFPIPDAPPMNHYGEPDNYWCNSFTESGWIEFEVTDIGMIADWYITFTWTTNWAAMGRFYALSPSGTQFTIINGDPSGTYEIDTDVFDGEPADGTWRLWIVDDDFNCDGSHRATDIAVFIIPPVPGDLDGDQDVDLDDFGLFAECMAGPDVTTPPPGCDPATFDLADLDADNDVGLADSAEFQRIFGG